MEWAERQQKEIEKSGMNPVAKGYHKGRLGIVMREYNKGGLKQRKEAMEIKSMEADIDKKKAEYNEARKNFAPVDKVHKLREELDQMKHDYRAARFPKQYGNQGGGQPAAQSAPKPQASHPMAGEVQRDIDYWHQMQYGGRPSEKQKQDTIESMRMQYDDYLKTAEKNWKLAQSVPNLDEATRNKYKQKYETAKGKVEALKALYGEQ